MVQISREVQGEKTPTENKRATGLSTVGIRSKKKRTHEHSSTTVKFERRSRSVEPALKRVQSVTCHPQIKTICVLCADHPFRPRSHTLPCGHHHVCPTHLAATILTIWANRLYDDLQREPKPEEIDLKVQSSSILAVCLAYIQPSTYQGSPKARLVY